MHLLSSLYDTTISFDINTLNIFSIYEHLENNCIIENVMVLQHVITSYTSLKIILKEKKVEISVKKL